MNIEETKQKISALKIECYDLMELLSRLQQQQKEVEKQLAMKSQSIGQLQQQLKV